MILNFIITILQNLPSFHWEFHSWVWLVRLWVSSFWVANFWFWFLWLHWEESSRPSPTLQRDTRDPVEAITNTTWCRPEVKRWRRERYDFICGICCPICKTTLPRNTTRFSFHKNTVYKNISLRFGQKIRTS